jgi:hypothetical protein
MRTAAAGDHPLVGALTCEEADAVDLRDNLGSAVASTVRFSRPHQGAITSLISKRPLSAPGRLTSGLR